MNDCRSSVGLSITGFMSGWPSGVGNFASAGAVAARWWMGIGGGFILRSAETVFFSNFSDLFDGCFRSEDGMRPPFEEDILLVGVIVVVGETGELIGFGLSCVGVSFSFCSSGGECFGELVVVRDRLGSPDEIFGSWETVCSSRSESISLVPTKGEGGMIVTLG